MKFIRLLFFDLKNGIWKNRMMFLVPILVGTITFFEATNRITHVSEVRISQEISFGDYFLYLYGGMPQYVPSATNYFEFPVVWMIVIIAILYLVLNYPFKNLAGVGQHILVQAKGRVPWWISKCIWNITSTLLYHAFVVGTILIGCLMRNNSISGQIHKDLIELMFQFSQDIVLRDVKKLTFIVCLSPILFSVSLNMLQMTISLFIKPIYSYILSLSILLSSAYLMKPYMIGNYAMMIRFRWIWEKGLMVETGILVSLVIIMASIVVGMIRIYHLDILPKE